MNIALEKTEEFVDGKLRRNYGDAFVRGNNGQLFYFSFITMLCAQQQSSALHFLQLIRSDRSTLLLYREFPIDQ